MGFSVPVADPGTAYRQMLAVSMPSKESIASQIAHVPQTKAPTLSRHGARYEAPRWFLVVSPGTVRVTCRLTTPKEHWGHNDEVDDLDISDAPKRGRVSDFSPKSRARMTDAFRSLDYTPLFENGDFPALVTLTAPADWEAAFPTPRSFKKKVDHLKVEYKRRWGHTVTGVWKMEFQERGAPHLHILMTPPRGRTRGTGESFTEWLSKTWARIVSSQLSAEEYAKHLGAGTGVDWIEGQRYSDPRRIAVYFDKHAGYHEKDYQNEMPQLWRDAVANGEPGALFWGYWNLTKISETIELTRDIGARSRSQRRGFDLNELGFVDEPAFQPQGNPHYVKSAESAGSPSAEPDADQEQLRWVRNVGNGDWFESDFGPRKYEQTETAVVVMRHLRKLARSQSYVRVTEVTRWSVNERTGEITMRKRKVNRRHQYLKNQTHGYLAVNDGAATARDIARLLGGDPPPYRKSDVSLVS